MKHVKLDRVGLIGQDSAATLDFRSGPNLVYGASNTGKSFACKTIDFMLGGQKLLPDILERRKYERALLALTLPKSGQLTLFRSLQGGAYEVVDGFVDQVADRANSRVLSARHDSRSQDNLSSLLLGELGLFGKQIAVDSSGTKRGLSFRDLVHLCIVDETSIQAERSPIETGNPISSVAERSVFKLLITGQDDSAIATVMKPKDFRTSRSAKIQVIEEMLAVIDGELSADYPDSVGLSEQLEKLDATFGAAQKELEDVRVSVRALISDKRRVSAEILSVGARLAEIDVNLERFEQLDAVYLSDIQRLESLEEVGFLLTLGTDRACPLCGAAPADQKHVHDVDEIAKVQAAAVAEIAKINRQRAGLVLTIAALQNEQARLSVQNEKLNSELLAVEGSIERAAPNADKARYQVAGLMEKRDSVRHGMELVRRRADLATQLATLMSVKRISEPKPVLGMQSMAAQDFAALVSSILDEWRFPGKLNVSFDEQTQDLRIDGKLRRDNGKGVRAITHSAFKIGLLKYCFDRKLPHPGFVVLDSPLVTFRDPIGSRNGPLSSDEEELKNSSLKEYFFHSIASMKDCGQIIVLENVDPPSSIEKLAHVHTFTGHEGEGRRGFL